MKKILTLDQLLISFSFRLLSKFSFINVEVDSSEFSVEEDKKYIFVANHSTKRDPFLILSFIPNEERKKLLPIRFLTYDGWLDNFFLRNFLYACGCFSTDFKRNGNIKPLELAKKYLEDNQSVFIFPEGRRNPLKNMNSQEIGTGAVYLERDILDAYLIPVRIEYDKNDSNHIFLKYGRPFRHQSFPKDLKPLAKNLMDKIYGI